MELNEKIPKNTELILHFKPTLDNESIKILQTKEKIIEYYQFFDILISAAKNINNPNLVIFDTVPNTASPSPHTTEDGILFANLCRLCNEIQNEGCDKYFKIYKYIMPYGRRAS